MRGRRYVVEEAGDDAGLAAPTREQAEAHCRDCSFFFRFDATFYRARGLQPPKRCLRCRERRRCEKAAPMRLAGRVEAEHADHVFLLSEAGCRYFAARRNVAATDWPLTEGAGVTFEPAEDAADYQQPGRHPRAFLVRV
jgi:hypothetical protein